MFTYIYGYHVVGGYSVALSILLLLWIVTLMKPVMKKKEKRTRE